MLSKHIDAGLKPFHSSVGAAAFAERDAQGRPVCVLMVLPRKVKGKLELWQWRAELTTAAKLRTGEIDSTAFDIVPVTRITG